MESNLEKRIKRVNWLFTLAVIVLFLVTMSGQIYSNYSEKVKQAQMVSGIVEENLKIGDKRNVAKILSLVQENEFSKISFYKSNQHVVTFPTIRAPSYNKDLKPSLVEKLVSKNYTKRVFFDKKETSEFGKLVFTIFVFEGLLYALLVWCLLLVILFPITAHYKRLVMRSLIQKSEKDKVKAINEVVRQVRHDSRGIVQAVESFTSHSSNLSADQVSFLSSTIGRLEKMVEGINVKNINKDVINQDDALVHLHTCLYDIIREKKAVYSSDNIKINLLNEKNSFDIFVKAYENDLKRILSNILDNSRDAVLEKDNDEGLISIEAIKESNNIIIKITDNGIGIDQKNITRIGEKGFTTKVFGNGLGVSWAKDKLREWSGSIKYQNTSSGVLVKITLNSSEKVVPIATELNLSSYKSVRVLDDDFLVIQRWKKSIGETKPVSGYLSPVAFLSEQNKFNENDLLIIDYDLSDDNLNGIDVIDKIAKKGNAILSTNNFDDKVVQDFCINNNISLLPKTLVQHII